MEVDCISNATVKAVEKDKGRGKGKGKTSKPETHDKECYVCGKKGRIARDRWSRIHQDQTVNEL